jgi:avidin family protein
MSLTGVWLNELNSIMVLNDHPDGTLTGKYRSLVGRDSHIRDLAGRTSAKEGGKQMLGFAVCFEIDNPGPGYGHYSLCTWSGWERDEEITTHWLLTISILNQQDEWSSTLIGEDAFEKILDTPEEKHLESSKEILAGLLAKARG